MGDMDTFQELSERFTALETENFQLQEALNSVERSFAAEDKGWTPLSGVSGSEGGLSLSQAKEIARECREMSVGNPWIDRGLDLRFAYVWSKGVLIPGIDVEQGERRGRKSNLETFYRHPVNQRSLFSDEAHHVMERSVGTDGCFLLLGDEKTKTVRPFPLEEVADILTNPEFGGEVWAVRREWATGDGSTTQSGWIYSDTYSGERQKTIKASDGKRYPVLLDRTLLDFWVNRQVGWPIGIPDAVAAVPWARIATEMYNHGRTMTAALARFAAKVTGNKSRRGASNVGVKMGQGGMGQIAALGEGNDLDIFSAAGKTYQFDGLRPIVANVATALEVSLVHLTSDPGSAGSSYGSASNLDLPTKRSMVSRQAIWKLFLERVIRWGANVEVNVAFPPLDDDPYRIAQSYALAWNTGLYHPDELRGEVANALGIRLNHEDAPEGVMTPNNEKFLASLTADDDVNPTATAASPDQGQSNGSGGMDSGSKNDERTDTLG